MCIDYLLRDLKANFFYFSTVALRASLFFISHLSGVFRNDLKITNAIQKQLLTRSGLRICELCCSVII